MSKRKPINLKNMTKKQLESLKEKCEDRIVEIEDAKEVESSGGCTGVETSF